MKGTFKNFIYKLQKQMIKIQYPQIMEALEKLSKEIYEEYKREGM